MDLDTVLAIARRQWRIVAIAVAVSLFAAVAYIKTSVPLYTATASLLIDRANNGLLNRLTMEAGATDDETSILSQIEVLKSDSVGLAAVDKLKLNENALFVPSDSSTASSFGDVIGSLFGRASASTEIVDRKRQSALASLQQDVSITRVGRSDVLSVSFTSASPELSAEVASAVADAYVTDRLDAKYDAARRASDWLQGRIEELRQKALESDLAVQKFRADNGLITTGGQLVSDQELSQLNSELVAAGSEAAQAKAKLDRVQQTIQSGQPDGIMADVLDNSISNELRQKYLDASKQEADISNRFGSDHPRAVQIRAEMQEYKRLMLEELSRVSQSYKSAYDVALSRQNDLKERLLSAKAKSAAADELSVQLRELERSAESYRSLYQTFLQRYQETVQQQSFPITEARVISRPTTPNSPSAPRKPLIMALFCMFGAFCGAGVAAFREFRDSFFRTGDQVRSELGQEFLGYAPILKGSDPAVDAPLKKPKTIEWSAISHYVVNHPDSAFAEVLRNVKIAVDNRGGAPSCRVIGVASTLPNEGKSMFSINLALLLAMQGAKTLLIDCDLRKPGSTKVIAPHANLGLAEAINAERAGLDFLFSDPLTNLSFLPVAIGRRTRHSSGVLSSQAMTELLEAARDRFDYIVLDLPPVAPVIDAKAIAPQVDDFVYLAEWGKTSRKVVRSTLRSNMEISSKCIGVVLSKVDTEKMKLYQTYGSDEYYSELYKSYYADA